jgi:hypothetical protein
VPAPAGYLRFPRPTPFRSQPVIWNCESRQACLSRTFHPGPPGAPAALPLRCAVSSISSSRWHLRLPRRHRCHLLPRSSWAHSKPLPEFSRGALGGRTKLPLRTSS